MKKDHLNKIKYRKSLQPSHKAVQVIFFIIGFIIIIAASGHLLTQKYTMERQRHVELPIAVMPVKPLPSIPIKAPVLEKSVPNSILKPQPVYLAIVIDDMGLNSERNERFIRLPAALTFSFLPYGRYAAHYAEQAFLAGHEVMIHLPMQPVDVNLDSGPLTLKINMGQAEIAEIVRKAVLSIPHAVGINNHMGSGFTQNYAAMTLFLSALKPHNLYFLDSKTIHNSVGNDVAKQVGVDFIARDVFIDHIPVFDDVVNALEKAENTAKKKGSAIAIGHPKDVTYDALHTWMTMHKDDNTQIVPVSALLKRTAIPSGSSANDTALKPAQHLQPPAQ